jgi:hypothetical protein
MKANVFHFMFIPTEELQTQADLENMFVFLFKRIKDEKKIHLLQSRTLENRSPLVFALCHKYCSKQIVERLIDPAELFPFVAATDILSGYREDKFMNSTTDQLVSAFNYAAKHHIENLDLLEPLSKYLDRAEDSQRVDLIQIACRYDYVEMLKWLIEKEN